MSGPLLHAGATINCTHAAAAQVVPGNARVTLGGLPVATLSDQYPVAGCPFQIPVGAGTKPSPCIRLQWTTTATRVLVNGVPPITAGSSGLGLSPESAPQGPPIPVAFQTRVVAL